LGLAIVRSIMRLHGGEVEVRSQPGKETEFMLVFPGSGMQEPVHSSKK
jgi:two-component system heavy metal sensor histidine kinase CusS